MRLAIAALCFPAITAAQTASSVRVPIRTLVSVAASRDTFGAPVNVQATTGGRLFVNDAKLHRLVLLDSTMHTTRVVLDSISGSSNSYGTRPEPLLAFGDSAVFVDHASQTFVVIGADGSVGRTIAAPSDRGIWTVVTNSQGIDQTGRMFYRGITLRRAGEKPKPVNVRLVGYDPGGPISSADSLPLIRGDLNSGHVDTIAVLNNALAKRTENSTDAKGQTWNTSYINPTTAGDEWALLSDGTIAIVRGHDYHVDWISNDGTLSSSPKMPFDWKRLTDEDKKRIRDSTMADNARSDSLDDARLRAALAGSNNTSVVSRSRSDGASDAPPQIPRRNTIVVPIDSFRDYYPSVRPSAARGDRDGNLWVLPTTSAQSLAGELVYDVVNRKGDIAYRVRLPKGRSIAGFGPGGVVYLLSGDISRGFIVERARAREGN